MSLRERLAEYVRACFTGLWIPSHEHEDEYCAIYAINSLIGCSQTAAPPAVPLPPIAGRVQVAIGHQSLLAERRHAGSQARAPPIV